MGTVYRAAQLKELGIGRRRREELLKEGRLHRVEHGVYCTAPAEGDLLLEAVALTRPHLVFAGATARQIYDGKTVITPLKGQVARPHTYQDTPLLTVTQVRSLPHRSVNGHRVVTPLAAIRDLLDTDASAVRTFLEKHYAGREGNTTLAADLQQFPRLPASLRDIIASASIASDSKSEQTLARALKIALKGRGVSVIQNHELGFYHWDYAIPEAKILIDLDSFRYHAALPSGENETTFIIDRWKANDGARRGWLVLHYTGECVYRHANKVVEQIVDTVVWRLNGGGPSSDILPARLSFEDTSLFRWHFTLRVGGTEGW
ncbi:MAG: type IV toxin-antitoxin system AbiEi family antitoxin domain-containing protein [Corynebacterium sp.]|uniref:type IV toxin-antitoxin system AbiEi family antitoxin domain-containing protein n=1 Tax=Corynebacterium sp. TaxID=1720 RepID=UPI0026DFFDA4|nr:type IV toxin-antitoxin system AbiEi family antitoxin domain-containing protein [Corynebacterium sp.]MDO5668383.1 type IV toxin-antitoxin system AbiEi family antitoxin domain-containing protein [Corynebacterium sp.]